MLQLVPHLLLRTNAECSEAAVALRDGNYLVSRVTDDELALELATYTHVDAVVIELPLFAAIQLANAALVAGIHVPLLIITRAPEAVRRAVSGAVAVHDAADLVTSVDLTLARFPAYGRSMAS